MGDSNIVESEGKRRFQGSGEFVADDTTLDDVLYAIHSGGTDNYKLYPDTVNATNVYYQGSMWLSGGLNIAVGQTLTGNVTLRAAGNITLTTS